MGCFCHEGFGLEVGRRVLDPHCGCRLQASYSPLGTEVYPEPPVTRGMCATGVDPPFESHSCACGSPNCATSLRCWGLPPHVPQGAVALGRPSPTHLQQNPPPVSRAWPGGTDLSLLPQHTPAPSGCRSGIRSPGVPHGLSRWVWNWQGGAGTVGGTAGGSPGRHQPTCNKHG